MYKITLALLFALIVPTMALATTYTVEGRAAIIVPAEIVEIEISVTSTPALVEKDKEQMDWRLAGVLEAINALNLENVSIEILEPTYVDGPGVTKELKRTFTLSTTEIDKIDSIVQVATIAGADHFTEPKLRLEDDSQMIQQALKMAAESGYEQAKKAAKSKGYQLQEGVQRENALVKVVEKPIKLGFLSAKEDSGPDFGYHVNKVKVIAEVVTTYIVTKK